MAVILYLVSLETLRVHCASLDPKNCYSCTLLHISTKQITPCLPTQSGMHSVGRKILLCFGRKRKDDDPKKPAKAKHLLRDNRDFDHGVPDDYANLDEVAAPMPVENLDENEHTYEHHTLEETRQASIR